jgi:GNAT superfamily N-acetyltransferase
MERTIRIEPARTKADIAALRELFLEYQEAIGVDLCFQGFREELASLPGAYAPPRGRLLIALVEGAARGEGDALVEGGAAGCVAMRPVDADTCEMKRLYARPAFRGTGLGRRLATRIIAEAREAGYRRMVLDTLSTMVEAIALYRSLGFCETTAYTYNPLPGALYFALDLGGGGRAAGGEAGAAPGGIAGKEKGA